MKPNIEIPDRLYKYRAFSDLTVQALVSDELFFADPSTFNDPLDAKPCLTADLPASHLKDLLGQLVNQRREGEMAAAAKALKYKGPKTISHIFKQSTSAANRAISDVLYHASNPDFDDPNALSTLLATEIESELLKRYEAGIFCLAERSDCPLMWSHYGGQHTGICLGYSVPVDVSGGIRKVEYDKNRLVKASDVAAMLAGDNAAKQRVDGAVLLRKAPDWKYENEWRLIGERGLARNPLELEEVIFGLRCSAEVKFSLATAMAKRSRKVMFYEMRESRPSFELKKRELDFDEMNVYFPRRSRDVEDAFGPASDHEALDNFE
ncbi:Protein of unknown function [Thalassospira xiamenensis M-5 = DSM 17429]|uniref:DUF2971 domain-containing protein n=1 Tax=Thalassospira xiamenensis M-5 = DSM 17429 TaxID=1123366 RepID=A0AB72UA36_9PROT|nr:DUF2971 domain-containing protein [Thalassospira xiamenensis]AJD51088.1 hypothetical protein TH3_04840 [Thalassospira xiamenensis M-5 = DSM 17429]SIT32173.1 Protein of unknown function [Thalassospira xiamenensis M-5 = DSM 17429]